MSWRLSVLAGSMTLAMVVSLAWGQDPKTTSQPDATAAAKAAKRAIDLAKRVPPYFGQVGLTPEQRERIYAIRTVQFEKIAALKAQLEKVTTEMMAESEAVLTAPQKDMLKQRRDAAKAAREQATKARAEAKAKAGTTEPSKDATAAKPD